MVFAVFVFQELEPVDGYFHHVRKLPVNIFNFFFDACNEFIGLVLVELQYALHLYFHEPQDVFFGYLANHLRIVWCEPVVDMFADGVHVGRVFEFLVFVDALLDEDFLQRVEMQLFQEFSLPDFQFTAQKSHRAVDRVAEHVGNRQELRLVVLDDTAVGGDVYLAIGECIECVDGLVARHAG